MKRKAPLSMMELMVMIAVFALAAALCLQAFVKSDQLSRRVEARDRAAVLCQSVAEALRHFGAEGDMGYALGKTAEEFGYWYRQGMMWHDLDENWNPVENGVYRVESQGMPTDLPGLAKAFVRVVTGGDAGEELEILFELEISWQKEVTPRG